MIVALALVLAGSSFQGTPSPQEIEASNAQIRADLKKMGLVAEAYALPSGPLRRGIVHDSKTGFEGRWFADPNAKTPTASLQIVLRFDRAIDREAARARLTPDEWKAMEGESVTLSLGGWSEIEAGTSNAPDRSAWEKGVKIARGLQRATGAKTLPLPTELKEPRALDEIPTTLRVTSLSMEEMEQVAERCDWQDANIGGVSGMSPISRVAAPGAFIYILPTYGVSDRRFASEATSVRVDPQFTFENVRTSVQRQSLERELPGWTFGWDEGEGTGGSASWQLDLTPGYKVVEIASAIERESLRSDRFRKGAGKPFLKRW